MKAMRRRRSPGDGSRLADEYQHLLQIAAMILAAVTSGCHGKPAEFAEPVRPVLSLRVAPSSGPINGYSGIVDARYRTDMGFRVLGQLVSRSVEVGDSVVAGQTLGRLDDAILKVSVRSAEAAVANARAQNTNAASSLKRHSRLFEKGASTAAMLDLAKKKAEAAAAALVQAEADLEKAREGLSYAELKSDLTGVVTRISAERGETVSSGQPVFSIANPEVREAVIDIPEESIEGVEPQSQFRVLASSSGVECFGVVREISPQADGVTRTRRVRISLVRPPDEFRLGATIRAFPKGMLHPVVRLPATSILDDQGSSYVWVVDEEKKQVNRVAVTVSARSETTVEISGGLNDSQRVVIAGVHSLNDGQSIQFSSGDRG